MRCGSVQCHMLSNIQKSNVQEDARLLGGLGPRTICLYSCLPENNTNPVHSGRGCEHAPAVEQVPSLRRGDAVARVRGARAAGVPRGLQPGRQPCKSNIYTPTHRGNPSLPAERQVHR